MCRRSGFPRLYANDMLGWYQLPRGRPSRYRTYYEHMVMRETLLIRRMAGPERFFGWFDPMHRDDPVTGPKLIARRAVTGGGCCIVF